MGTSFFGVSSEGTLHLHRLNRIFTGFVCIIVSRLFSNQPVAFITRYLPAQYRYLLEDFLIFLHASPSCRTIRIGYESALCPELSMFSMWNGAPSGDPSRRPRGPPSVNLPSGTAHLLYELDKVLLFWLRDGRTFIGVLKSLDQFGNVVVSGTIERIYVGKEYGDIERGICILRGENLVLVGEWDHDKEEQSGTVRREIQYILSRQMEEEEKRLKVKEGLQKAMRERGLNIRDDPEDDLFVK